MKTQTAWQSINFVKRFFNLKKHRSMIKKLLKFLDLEPLKNEETLFQNKGFLFIVLFVFGMMLLAGFLSLR